MKRHFSSFGKYTIAEGTLDELQLSGNGGSAAPVLHAPLAINIDYGPIQPREGMQLKSVSAKLTVVTTGHVITRTEAEVNQLIVPKFTKCTNTAYLEFPLDGRRLHELERLRNGGDLALRLDATLVADQLYLLNPERQVMDPYVWAFCERRPMWLQSDITIPREVWIKRVLPQVGYGVVHLVEFPAASIEGFAALKHSYAALSQAEERHRMGYYDDAVGKCRVALEPFFHLVEEDDGKGGKKKVPRLKTSWETKLGGSTFDWLEGSMTALKLAANKNHHSPHAHFDQLESQMVLAITAAVISYAARAGGEVS